MQWNEKLLLTLEEVMVVTGYGRRRALSFVTAAGARVEFGKSVRYSVKRLQEFIDKEAH